MAAGRPAGHHDPVGLDLEVGGVVLHPGQRPLGVGDHPGEVGLGEQPVGHVHDHVALGGQVAEQRPGPDVLVKGAPGAAVQIHHGQPRRRHTRPGAATGRTAACGRCPAPWRRRRPGAAAAGGRWAAARATSGPPSWPDGGGDAVGPVGAEGPRQVGAHQAQTHHHDGRPHGGDRGRHGHPPRANQPAHQGEQQPGGGDERGERCRRPASETHRYRPTGRHRNGTYSRLVQARSRTAIPTPSASKTAQPVMATPSWPGAARAARPAGSLPRGCSLAGCPRTTLERAPVRRGRAGPNGPLRPGGGPCAHPERASSNIGSAAATPGSRGPHVPEDVQAADCAGHGRPAGRQCPGLKLRRGCLGDGLAAVIARWLSG